MSDAPYELMPLGSAIARHLGGGTPPRQVASYWKGEIPWASVKDFSDDESVISDTQERITQAGLNASASNLIPAGTPLVCTRMAVGRAALSAVPMAINQDVKALFPEAGVSPSYLLKMLRYIQPRAEGQAVGSTVKGIRVQDYLSIQIPLAPPEHQHSIARVLDTLDTAIRETEAIIAKLKAVKQGLLHDLLTRGIDANGELRPPQAEAPHLYKQSPLGWIPKEWEVRPVGVVSDVVYGISDAIEMNLKEGVKTITLPCVSAAGELSLAPDNLVYTAQRKVTESMLLRCGDLLFNWRNGSLNHLGKTAYFDAEEAYTHVGFLLRVRAKSDACIPGYLCAVLRYAKDSGVFLRAKGQVNNTFNSDELRSLCLAFPSVAEQGLIKNRLDSLGSIQEAEEATLRKLALQKSGLMDDLLTGRVRVTPLLSAEQRADTRSA